jgi:hydrogenase maturation protease
MRHVICFGNPLHGDDGFGSAVYSCLSQTAGLPADVRIFDAGTCGLNALSLFENCQEAILIDALEPNGQPGHISQPDAQSFLGDSSWPLHALDVGYLLKALSALDVPMPRIVVAEACYIQPFHPFLSVPMKRAVVEACRLVSQILGVAHA